MKECKKSKNQKGKVSTVRVQRKRRVVKRGKDKEETIVIMEQSSLWEVPISSVNEWGQTCSNDMKDINKKYSPQLMFLMESKKRRKK